MFHFVSNIFYVLQDLDDGLVGDDGSEIDLMNDETFGNGAVGKS